MHTKDIMARTFRDKAGEDGDPGGSGNSGESGEDKSSKDDKAFTPEQFEALQAQLSEVTGELDRFKAKHSEAEKHRKEAEKKAREEAEKAARESGNLEALEKSWQQKLADREAELRAALEAEQGHVKSLTVGQAAATIASELAIQGSASVLLPHIKQRLTTDYRDGKPVTIVLDRDGKASAQTLDELKDEIKNDPAFAPLIVGSRASGAGGSSGNPAGGSNVVKRSSLDKMSPKEKAAFYAKNPNVKIVD